MALMKCILPWWGMYNSKRKNADSLESAFSLAGALGLEPRTKVLETHVLPLHHTPMCHEQDIYYHNLSDLSTGIPNIFVNANEYHFQPPWGGGVARQPKAWRSRDVAVPGLLALTGQDSPAPWRWPASGNIRRPAADRRFPPRL